MKSALALLTLASACACPTEPPVRVQAAAVPAVAARVEPDRVVEYHANGLRSFEVSIVNGKWEGRALRWSSSGVVIEEGNYLAGQRHGLWEFRWSKEPFRMWRRGEYDKGLEQGEWEFWSKTGSLEAVGPFEDGHREGEWARWDNQGQRYFVAYAKGRVVK